MFDYLFLDNESGEYFFVEVETLDEAWEIARENFEDPEYVDTYSTEEADMLGYDTY